MLRHMETASRQCKVAKSWVRHKDSFSVQSQPYQQTENYSDKFCKCRISTKNHRNNRYMVRYCLQDCSYSTRRLKDRIDVATEMNISKQYIPSRFFGPERNDRRRLRHVCFTFSKQIIHCNWACTCVGWTGQWWSCFFWSSQKKVYPMLMIDVPKCEVNGTKDLSMHVFSIINTLMENVPWSKVEPLTVAV